jgi:signal transduction histidine kinase
MMLINDVLDFTKMETGNIELEKAHVNIRDMIQGVTSSMQYKAAEKNIYLKQCHRKRHSGCCNWR